jgi:hypothetical protein
VPARCTELEPCYRRCDGVEAREVDGIFFLIPPRTHEVCQLDQMASALWRALSTPRSHSDLVALFEAAFPNTAKRHIEKDIADLLVFLQQSRMIAKVRVRS